jgi:hypothetical protein
VVSSFGPGRLSAALLLAHQGGWDEALLVVGPVAVISGLLWLAKKRIDGQNAGLAAHDDGVDGGSDSEKASGAQTGEPGTRSIEAPTPARRPTKSS